MTQQIVVCLSDTKAIAFDAYTVVQPKTPLTNATPLVFGKTYRRVYQGKAGLYAIYMGKRKPVLLVNKGE